MKVEECESGGRRLGQDLEVDGKRFVERARGKGPEELLPSDSRQVSANASDQRRLERTQTEEVRKTPRFAHVIERKCVTRVLAVSVVERVVRVPLIVERPDAGALERGTERELPSERALDVMGERACCSPVRSQHRVDVTVGSAVGQEPSTLPLHQHDPRNDPTSGRNGRDGPAVLQPDRHVESDGVAQRAAIEVGGDRNDRGGPDRRWIESEMTHRALGSSFASKSARRYTKLRAFAIAPPTIVSIPPCTIASLDGPTPAARRSAGSSPASRARRS